MAVARVGKILAWIVAIIIILVVALVVFIATFNWNHARGWIDDKVTQAIGRPFAINGDLSVSFHRPEGERGWRAWVPWPRFTAHDLTVGNPDWARRPQFAKLDEVDFEVEILPLLKHAIVIPAVHLHNPTIDVERMADGRNNWTFKTSSSKPSSWKLDLRDIAFAKGEVDAYDEQKKADFKVLIDTLGQPIPFGELMAQQREKANAASAQAVGATQARKLQQQTREAAAAREASAASAVSESAPVSASASSASRTAVAANASSASAVTANPAQGAAVASQTQAYSIGLTIKGTYNAVPIAGTGKLGGVLALQDAKRPFPIQVDLQIGDSHIAILGTLTDPVHLADIDLQLWLSGVSMAHLYPLVGINLPSTPPYATSGRLIGTFSQAGNAFTYENFTGRVGHSDIGGTLHYSSKGERPSLKGTLKSKLLDFGDLAPIIGADSAKSQKKRGAGVKQPANKALPVETFRTDRWKAMDVDVQFTGERIIRKADLPISDLFAHIVMKDGVLTLEPVRFGVAGGTMATDARLDGSRVPLKGRFDVKARHLKLKQLFPKFETMKSSLGEINGDAELSATGNSPAALAASSNGEVKMLMSQGAISRTLLEEAGLNVANIVVRKLFGDQTVEINCAAADFVVTDGVLDSKVFALDTNDALITVDGKINMQTEAMDLHVHPKTKGFRVLSLRSPLYVKGTFKKPSVGVDVAALALRGGAAVGLGLINPFAALIPLIAPSHTTGSPCAKMWASIGGTTGNGSGHGVAAPPAPGQRDKTGKTTETGKADAAKTRSDRPSSGASAAAASGASAVGSRASGAQKALPAPVRGPRLAPGVARGS